MQVGDVSARRSQVSLQWSLSTFVNVSVYVVWGSIGSGWVSTRDVSVRARSDATGGPVRPRLGSVGVKYTFIKFSPEIVLSRWSWYGYLISREYNGTMNQYN